MDIQQLIADLRHDDATVRQQAAVELAQLGDARAVEPLTIALADADARVRRWAAVALAQIGAPAFGLLVSLLRHSDGGVRSVVAMALGGLRDARAVPPLVAALRDDEGIFKRSPLDHRVPVARLRPEDPHSDERVDIAAALERIGTPEALAAVAEFRQTG
jgi:HEAT repeat protein